MINLETAQRLASYGNGIYGNALINGNFDIWQRGTGTFSSTGYTADRWKAEVNTGTVAITRQSFANGQVDVPNNPLYYLRSVINSQSGTSGFCVVDQRIEDVRTFSGQTVSGSFWVKANAPSYVSIEFSQVFGASGGSDNIFGIGAEKFAVGTSWAKIEFTKDIPSVSGKTITDGNKITFYIWMSAGTDLNPRTDSLGLQSGTFEIAQVQLNAGSQALPFCPRSYGEELALCQRYYQKWEGAAYLFGAGVQSSSTEVQMIFELPVTMRTLPTLTTSGTLITRDGSATHTVSAISISGFYNDRGRFLITAGGTEGRSVILYVPAGYLALDSEL